MAQYHRHFPRNKIAFLETLEAWILIASVFVAVWLIRTDAISWLIVHTTDFSIIGSFVEGLFFTSLLTTAPAIVAIYKSASYIPAWKLALIGGAGAVCGDLLIFRFLKSRLVEHILKVALHPKIVGIARAISHGPFSWLGYISGAIIIASPLPDELGLFMMGLSSIRLIQFIPLAFAANAVGIYLMALAAQHAG